MNVLTRIGEYEGRPKMVIKSAQNVEDIMNEVVNAHEFYAADYDKIYQVFNHGTILNIARRLYNFCKKNIKYRIETDALQTTKSPAAILKFGQSVGGDCKHYAQFIGGILDAISRNTGRKIDWCYRFASYKLLDGVPEHVFIMVCDENGNEIWVDPVLNEFNSRSPYPTNIIDKCPKKKNMLVRISGIGSTGFASVNEVPRLVAQKVCSLGYIPSDEELAAGYVSPMTSPGMSTTNYPTASGSGGSYLPTGTQPTIYQPPASPSIQYFDGDTPLQFPAGSGNKLPQNLRVVYPDTWLGKPVPAQLPKPLVIVNRLVLWPKIYDQAVITNDAFFWLRFLTIMMTPIVKAYSIRPNDWFVDTGGDHTEEDTVLGHTILFDMDNADTVDYVTNLPTIVPTNSTLITGVKYLVNGSNFIFPDRVPGVQPAAMPNITVVYPASYLGVPVPANFPKPVFVNGKLQLQPKGMDWNILKANNYFWLSFLTSVFVPIIEAYANNNYATWNNKLAERILYDLDTADIVDNYLTDPPDELNLFQKIFKAVGNVVEAVGKGLIKFVGIVPRQAFLMLVRINVHSFASGMQSRIDAGEGAELKEKWENIGGEYSALIDAINDGKNKNAILGVQNGVGVLPAAAAAWLAAAAPVIAILAGILSRINPQAGQVVNDALKTVNVMLTAAGEDPIAVGAATGAPVTVLNPNTGQPVTIYPPVKNTTGFVDWIKSNPVPAAAIGLAVGAAVYQLSKKKRTAK